MPSPFSPSIDTTWDSPGCSGSQDDSAGGNITVSYMSPDHPVEVPNIVGTRISGHPHITHALILTPITTTLSITLVITLRCEQESFYLFSGTRITIANKVMPAPTSIRLLTINGIDVQQCDLDEASSPTP